MTTSVTSTYTRQRPTLRSWLRKVEAGVEHFRLNTLALWAALNAVIRSDIPSLTTVGEPMDLPGAHVTDFYSLIPVTSLGHIILLVFLVETTY